MKLIIDIPNSLYANLNKIANGSIASKRLLDCIKNGTRYEERPHGEWVEEAGKIPHCSICGTYSDDADREDGGFYCTHCGASMRSNDNE